MQESKIFSAMSSMRECAWIMFENAIFIQNELDNVKMDEALRSRTESICMNLIGNKMDVFTELEDFGELLRSKPTQSAIDARVKRIFNWLGSENSALKRLVEGLETAKDQDPACSSAYVLVAESATNILKAYNAAEAVFKSFNSDEGI